MAFIHIAGNIYELSFENRNGWNVEAFRNRYSEVLERYDYIVGDWGYNQLRLKGFFKDGHQKATKDSTYSYMADYINEYCNFGCAYFVLEKKQGGEHLEPSDEDVYIDEIEYTRPIPVPKEKTAANTSNDEGAKSSASGKEQQSSNRNKRERFSGKDKQNNDATAEVNGEKQRRQQRNKGQAQQQSDKQEDAKQEAKKDGKSKRRDFYRKGNRSMDKKNKSKRGAEQASTVTTAE